MALSSHRLCVLCALLLHLQLLMGLDLLGNPGQMLGHLSSGIQDLYYEPFMEGISSIATHTLGWFCLFRDSCALFFSPARLELVTFFPLGSRQPVQPGW